MKFDTLHIENFLAVSEARLRLADRGLLLIQGINEDDPSTDSNGAGKSSVADALCWCLFGTTARGVTGDAVVNRTAGKGTRVALDAADGEDVYRIVRHRKHKTGKNALQLLKLAEDGTITDLSKGTDKLTQTEVEKVIGCSYEVFKAAVYAGQEQMPDLPAMTDKALKLLVEEAAGITILESAYELARGHLAAEKAELVKAEADLKDLLTKHAAAVSQLEDASARKADFEARRETAVSELMSRVRECAAEAKKVAAEADEHDRPAIEAALADVKVKIAAVEHERIEERRLADEAKAAELEVTKLTTEATRLKTDAERQKKAIDGIADRVGSPCGECGKAYCEDDLHDARTLATDKLKGIVAEFRAAKSRLDDARDRAQKLADALEAHRSSMTSVASLNALSDAHSESLRHIDGLIRQRDAWVEKAKLAKAQAEEKKAEPNPFEPQIAKIERTLEKLREEMGKIESEALPELQARVEIAEVAVKVYSPAGVRAQILDSVTPFLNDRTAAYLGTLSDGKISATWSTLSKTAKGELREKFQIDVTNDAGGDSFAALSGGEKRKVRVATALALQDLVASRAVKPIDLFVGDEIDDALDFAGLERLMAVLEEKARERGSVLVISHNALRDWISNVIVMTKKDGGSVMQEEAA